MTKKAVVALIVAAVVLTGTAVGAASSLWGEASEKPPCAEWRDRVFDKTTGEFLRSLLTATRASRVLRPRAARRERLRVGVPAVRGTRPTSTGTADTP